MAKVILNPAIQVISGDISGFVYRHHADGRVSIAKAGVRSPDQEPSPAQAAQMQKFKEASARYTRLIQDAGTKAAYDQVLAAAAPHTSLRALVMGDILSAPKIDTLDLSSYQGQVGDVIRVLVEDNVGVKRLELVIYDQTAQADLESATHDLSTNVQSTVEWVYSITAAVPADHAVEVRVAAFDLAGNRIDQTGSPQ
jgi:hypothetical protein